MRVLIPDSEGYIGTVFPPYLMAGGHDVIGVTRAFSARAGCTTASIERRFGPLATPGR